MSIDLINTDKTRLVRCDSCKYEEITGRPNPLCPTCKFPMITVIPRIIEDPIISEIENEEPKE